MNRKPHIAIALFVALAVVGCGGGTGGGEQPSAASAADGPIGPIMEVDPFWPKPLPNHWVMGNVIGVDVDDQDNVWIIHRSASVEPKEMYAEMGWGGTDCCHPAPPVLAFNPAGDLIHSWGGISESGEYDWPASNHGIDVDHKGNVWIGGNGRARPKGVQKQPTDEASMGRGQVHDSMVLKFTTSGKFLLQIGKPFAGKGSHDLENFKLPAKTLVDPKTNELYVADGYGNRRVIVLDADTGEYKRHWGAYGNEPDDTQLGHYNPDEPLPQQFRTPVHAVTLAEDGLLYACDRANDRIQVFQTDGTYVDEVRVAPKTLGDGSTFDVALSRDPEQKYMYVADGANHRIHVIERKSLKILTTFGDGGRQPGQFYAVHSVATDSKGNLFTTETYHGRRLQKFIYKGEGPLASEELGVVWPTLPSD